MPAPLPLPSPNLAPPGWRPFLAVVKKELSSVLRDRTILIAILIQLFIASFSSALLVGMLSLYDPDSVGLYTNVRINVAIASASGAAAGDMALLTGFLGERGVTAIPFASLKQAEDAYRQGQVRAILALPEAQPGGTVEMQLYLPRAEAAASLILNLLQEPLKRYENALRQRDGIEMRYTELKGRAPTTFEFIYTVILPILMLFPAFVAGGMVVDSLSEEVENNTLETLLASPLTFNTAVSAKICAAWLLAVVQCLAWLGLLRMNAVVIQNFLPVLALAAITAGIVTVGAAIITIVWRDRERSQFVYSLALLAAAAASFLLDLSPIKTMARLAIGDYYTGWVNVLVFAAILAGAAALFVAIAGRRRA